MAFHVACPITCRKICYCKLGFPGKLQSEKAKNEFVDEVVRIQQFLNDPWLIKANKKVGTVQVFVPKVVPPPPPVVVVGGHGSGGGGGSNVEETQLSVQAKRVAIQKKAAATVALAEDFANRFASGDLAGAVKDEEQGLSNVKVMCRLCFSGENEGSERARKMLPCKSCGKKYHRSCLKAWAQNRDLFHWSSWTCPSCRICEVCRSSESPNKFMFCKRCDGAYHCFCQQPPHKNVSSGPYLCPKHTRCHSCGSTVPGNGLSVRWFLGYTCCDACGRLFVKGNYCPVCLKVYRDSESTPMVCCDICQRWVHCQCDGISDEKYLQFQMDGNLQYRCATCRGECYQVRDPEDAVQELWRRRDIADRDLIANLRAAAGLPTQEEIFSISPFSDDEESGPMISKNESGRSLKFSLKGLVDKSPKKNKEYGKKSSNKKYGKKQVYQAPSMGKAEANKTFDGNITFGYATSDDKNDTIQPHRIREPDLFSSPIAGSLTEGICSINEAGVLKHKFLDEVTGNHENRTSRTAQINSSKPQGSFVVENAVKNASKSKTNKGPKLVIHLGARNKNVTNSPRSDASSCQRDHDLTTSNGSEDIGQHRVKERYTDRDDTAAKFGDIQGENLENFDQLKTSKHRGREGNLIKIKKFSSEGPGVNAKSTDPHESVSSVQARLLSGKGTTLESTALIGNGSEASTVRRQKSVLRFAGSKAGASSDLNKDNGHPLVSHSAPKDLKPLLKFKLKNLPSENQSLWSPQEEDEKFSKGQRSKRKRPVMEKISAQGELNTSQWYEEEEFDANWILEKLGRDAIGKRVEVNQPADNSWHRGTVKEIFEGTSVVSVALDDGRSKNYELGKQRIRFVSQKQKR